MKKSGWFLVLSVLLGVSCVVASDISETRLVDKEGAVYLQLAGSDDGDMVEAIEGTPLEQGDRIVTGPNGAVRFMIESESIVELGPHSDFTIEKSNESGFQFFLSAGELFAKIRNLLENKKSMAIRTPVAVAAVRGTELVVAHDIKTDKSDVAVFDEGKLSVTSTSTGEEASLASGQEVTLVRGLGRPTPRPLRRFEGHRERLQRLRERRDFFRKEWRSQPLKERRDLRQKLRQERKFRQNRDIPSGPRRHNSPKRDRR